MEQSLSASKAALISALDFGGPPPIADYVQSRSSIQVFPQGGDGYKPTGLKQMRFSLSTSGPFVDMSSLALQARLHNRGTGELKILGPGLGTLIQEARIYLGNVEVERVPFYNRTEAMLQRFMPMDKRIQLYDEQLGYESGTIAGNDFVSTKIDPSPASRTIVWRPQALGLCAQKNYLPSAFISGGCIVELLLVNTAAEVCDTSGNNSDEWELTDVKLLVDVVSVDPGMLTSMSKFLLNGGSLTLNPKCYSSVMYSVNAESMQLVHARAYTRLNSAFLTFAKVDEPTKKQCNRFYLAPTGQDLSMQTQVGERIIPDHRCDNLSQHYHRLIHCMGVASSPTTINLTMAAYKTDSWVGAVDFEAVPGQAHGSGMSTHNSQLTMDLRGLGTGGTDLPSLAYLCCWFETLIEISQDGVSVAL